MKAQILKNHGIETKIEGTFLFALEVVFNCNTNTDESKWVNISNWSTGKLYNWLGY